MALRSGRPTSRPGKAEADDYRCFNELYDSQAEKYFVCRQPVPAGELTWVALDAQYGHYLALCAECRKLKREDHQRWLKAAVSGPVQLKSPHFRLPDERLVAYAELKAILLAKAREVNERGPMKTADALDAVEILFGAKVRKKTEEMLAGEAKEARKWGRRRQ